MSRRGARGDSSKALRRRSCPKDCFCLCHDTNGGVKSEHIDGQGPCPGKVLCPECGARPSQHCAGLPQDYHDARRVEASTWTRTNS